VQALGLTVGQQAEAGADLDVGCCSLNFPIAPDTRVTSASVGPRPLATRQTRLAPALTPASALLITSSGLSQVYLSTSAVEPSRCEQ